MKILFIGSVYDVLCEPEVINNTKVTVNFSENNFQRKILKGFQDKSLDLYVLSAPAIGSYPNNYTKISFKKFTKSSGEYHYVSFSNIWGWRNISRARNLKKKIKKLHLYEYDLIVVYSVHTPFLEAASYAKKKNPHIKTCLIVPDLPEFMNQNQKKTIIYNVAKRFDIKKFYKLNRIIDSYILLTESMNQVINKGNKPYKVQEGIVDSDLCLYRKNNNEEKHIVYAGKLNAKFGMENMINAFMSIKDESVFLDICGNGEYSQEIVNYALRDKRIIYHGPLAADELEIIKNKADLFINPRLNNDEYTKYSFPSKNIEYLVTGKPVVTYLLDGMSEEYKNFIYVPKDDSVSSLAETILSALSSDNTEKNAKFIKYAKNNLLAISLYHKIISLLKQ